MVTHIGIGDRDGLFIVWSGLEHTEGNSNSQRISWTSATVGHYCYIQRSNYPMEVQIYTVSQNWWYLLRRITEWQVQFASDG